MGPEQRIAKPVSTLSWDARGIELDEALCIREHRPISPQKLRHYTLKIVHVNLLPLDS
jgi:hypothetical protein